MSKCGGWHSAASILACRQCLLFQAQRIPLPHLVSPRVERCRQRSLHPVGHRRLQLGHQQPLGAGLLEPLCKRIGKQGLVPALCRSQQLGNASFLVGSAIPPRLDRKVRGGDAGTLLGS